MRKVDSSGQMWDYPTVIVRLDAKRRFGIPAALAPASPGDQFDATFDANEDTVTLRRVKRKANWLEVWKKCPVPMDDIPSRQPTAAFRRICGLAEKETGYRAASSSTIMTLHTAWSIQYAITKPSIEMCSMSRPSLSLMV
jgi:hypothetical protein